MKILAFATIPGCQACLAIKDQVQNIATQAGAQFTEINVSDNVAFRNANGITVTPTILVFEDNLDTSNKIAQFNGGDATTSLSDGNLIQVLDPPILDDGSNTDGGVTFGNSFDGLTLGLFGLIGLGIYLSNR